MSLHNGCSHLASACLLLLTVIPLLTITVSAIGVIPPATSATPSAVHGAAYSMFFDGTVSNSIIQVSPSCADSSAATSIDPTLSVFEQGDLLDALPVSNLIGSRPSRTLMAWVRLPVHLATVNDLQIVGHPFEKGPRLFLGSGAGGIIVLKIVANGIPVTCLPVNQTHFNGTAFKTPNNFLDGRWHHIAYSQNMNHTATYVDGQMTSYCSLDTTQLNNVKLVSNPNSIINIGVYDDGIGSANSNSFAGYLDEIRIFAAYYDQPQIASLMTRGWLTAAEQARCQLWFTFDDGGSQATIKENLVWDYSGQGNHGSMGGTSSPLRLRYPKYTAGNTLRDSMNDNVLYRGNPSTIELTNAPVLGRVKLVKARQITQTPTTSNANDITIQFEPLDPATYASTTFTISNIIWGNLTSPATSHGQLFATNTLITPLDLSQSTASFTGVSLTYRPSMYESGEVLTFTVQPGGSLATTSSFIVQVLLVPNNQPVAGGSGGALYCDGVNDYAFNADFTWPMIDVLVTDSATGTNRTIHGGSPYTAEFWAIVTPESEQDSGFFSVGNAESNSQWVDGFNPYREQGRFLIRVPNSDGTTDQWMQAQTINTNVRIYYYKWTHFAYAHDQVNGTGAWIYIDGVLAAYGTHDHLGAGLPGNNIKNQQPVKTISLCTWSFWSEVYHRGHLDEFRLWTYVRTPEQIRADMYRGLTGSEPGLIAYYTFDDLDTISPPRGENNDVRACADMSGHGHTLWLGGCAPCDPDDYYHRGWMPYDPSHGILPPTNISEEDAGGPGYRVCLPSAKSYDSPAFELGVVYGATSHCFGTMAQSDPTTYPTRLVSTAPVASHQYQQFAEPNQEILILLNATDPDALDSFDGLQYLIESIPSNSAVRYTSDGGQTYTAVTPGMLLPRFVKSIYFLPTGGYGGAPLGSIRYHVTDGLLSSTSSDIYVYVQCPRGTYIDHTTHACMNCTAGTYQPIDSLNEACLPCARHQYQDGIAALGCKQCTRGEEYQPNTGSSSCLKCADLFTQNDGISGASLVANDYQCRTPVARSDLTSSLTTSTDATGATVSALFIDLLNQTSSLGLFDTTKPILGYIASLPQVGKLFQAKLSTDPSAGVNGGSSSTTTTQAVKQKFRLQYSAEHDHYDYVLEQPRHEELSFATTTDSTEGVGPSLSDPFYSLATPSSQYVASVVDSSSVSSRAGHPTSSIIGPPDVLKYGTSSSAWSPLKSAGGSDFAAIIVNFSTPMYVQSVTVYESYNPGGVILLEAFNPNTNDWFPFWYLSDADLQTALTSQALPATIRKFSPKDSCPTLFLCNTIRITWQLSLPAGSIEVDAISLNGVSTRAELGFAWIDGNKVAYQTPPEDQVPATVAYQDSFSYVVRDCSSSPVSVRNSMQLSFASEPMPTFKASSGLQKAVYALSGICIAVILIVMAIVFHYRQAVIIRSSNFPFCMATLFFHLLLPISSVFMALQPSEGIYVCHLRTWMTSIGIVGILAALVTKTNQNRAIFNNVKLVNSAFSQSKLASMIGVMVGLQIVLLIIYSAIPLTNPIVVPGSGKTSGSMVWQCSATSGHSSDLGSLSGISNTSFDIWLGFQFCYVFLFLVTVCYMAFQVRAIPAAFNEASAIMNCVFCLAVFLFLLIPLQFLIDSDVDALILIRGIGQNIGCIMLVVALFGPKLYYIAIGKGNDRSMQKTLQTRISHNDSGGLTSGTPTKGGGSDRMSITGDARLSMPKSNMTASSATPRQGNAPLPLPFSPRSAGHSKQPSSGAPGTTAYPTPALPHVREPSTPTPGAPPKHQRVNSNTSSQISVDRQSVDRSVTATKNPVHASLRSPGSDCHPGTSANPSGVGHGDDGGIQLASISPVVSSASPGSPTGLRVTSDSPDGSVIRPIPTSPTSVTRAPAPIVTSSRGIRFHLGSSPSSPLSTAVNQFLQQHNVDEEGK